MYSRDCSKFISSTQPPWKVDSIIVPQRASKFHEITQLRRVRLGVSKPGNPFIEPMFQLIQGVAGKEDRTS